MCLLTFAIDEHADYPFIFAGNRDEFHARPTASAQWWEDAPDVFGGRDLEAGGTWLGIRRDGRFAVVTNYRDPDLKPADALSRGELVRRFLATNLSMSDMHAWLIDDAVRFAGFNLLYGQLQVNNPAGNLWYFSNVLDTGPERLQSGIHGLSNHLLDTPWPKVVRTRERLADIIRTGETGHDALLDMLDDPEPADDDDLPDTGIPLDWERRLSAPKIISDTYGTRAATTLLLDRHGRLSFRERSFDATGSAQKDIPARFELVTMQA